MDLFFFFNDTATTEIYTLSLHDALPIWFPGGSPGNDYSGSSGRRLREGRTKNHVGSGHRGPSRERSEEHTSELQSRLHLVCRLLLEKKTTTGTDVRLVDRLARLPIDRLY